MTLHLGVPDDGGMIDAAALLAQFIETVEEHPLILTHIDYVGHPVRHRCRDFDEDWPKTWEAVYAFALLPDYGLCPDAGRVLKVGLTQRPSRIVKNHFDHRVPSSLAAAILANPVVWPYLGLSGLTDEYTAGDWIRESCYVAIWPIENVDHRSIEDYDDPLVMLERFMRARLGPVFEGTGGTLSAFGRGVV